MSNYELPLAVTHKKQTKANDCWYACIQMLNSWRHKTKTKPTGDHTTYLHSGLLGHRLHADKVDSKHFTHVLTENKIRCIKARELRISMPSEVTKALQTFGPVMLGGSYGDVGPMSFGHYIVLAGISADSSAYFIHDPAKKDPGYRAKEWVESKFWGDDESAFVCDI
jgi:hypothetical protein